MTRHQNQVIKIASLLALAKSTTFPAERESARSKASRLMQKWSISVAEVSAFMQSLKPKPRPVRRTVLVVRREGWNISVDSNNVNISWERHSYRNANTTSGTY